MEKVDRFALSEVKLDHEKVKHLIPNCNDDEGFYVIKEFGPFKTNVVAKVFYDSNKSPQIMGAFKTNPQAIIYLAKIKALIAFIYEKETN